MIQYPFQYAKVWSPVLYFRDCLWIPGCLINVHVHIMWHSKPLRYTRNINACHKAKLIFPKYSPTHNRRPDTKLNHIRWDAIVLYYKFTANT